MHVLPIKPVDLLVRSQAPVSYYNSNNGRWQVQTIGNKLLKQSIKMYAL